MDFDPCGCVSKPLPKKHVKVDVPYKGIRSFPFYPVFHESVEISGK